MKSLRTMDWSERYELPGMPCVFRPGQTASVFLKLRHSGLMRIEIPLLDESITESLDFIVRDVPEGRELARGRFIPARGIYAGTVGPLWITPGQSIKVTIDAPESGESIYFGCIRNEGKHQHGERLVADLVFLYARGPYDNVEEWVDRRIMPFMPCGGSDAWVAIMILFPSVMAILAWILMSAYAKPHSGST